MSLCDLIQVMNIYMLGTFLPGIKSTFTNIHTGILYVRIYNMPYIIKCKYKNISLEVTRAKCESLNVVGNIQTNITFHHKGKNNGKVILEQCTSTYETLFP